MSDKTHNVSDRRARLLPGGVGRGSLAYPLADGRIPFAVSASGCRITDDRGVELLDVNNNMTVNLHGHAHPVIQAAVRRRMDEGLVSLGLSNADEFDLADLLLERLPWGDWVRFANSGTEAVMLAVRLARAATGRDRIIVQDPGYHGMADAVLPSMGAYGHRGAFAGESTVTVAPRDLEQLEAVFDRHGGGVAALVLDVCSSRGGMISHSQEYVDRARELTSAYGALLIVDEVVTFRVGVSGLLSRYGVVPDLLTLGKTIGGGYPVGAVVGTAGTRGLLDPSDPDHIEHGGTFTANPITMSAGAAAMRLFDAAASERLEALSARLESRVGDRLEGTGWEFRRIGSVFRLWPTAEEASQRAGAQKALYRSFYENGVLSAGSGLSCLSTVMDEAVVDEIAEAAVRAAAAISA